ncbi:hypothetical protein BG005_002281 [Podila minutissima]|nr:hypothetical protein BG005_002281 [Podila minutissima]
MQNNDHSNSNDHPHQRFQSKTHQPLDSLELHEDPITGTHFVLWETIQWAFKNIDYLLNGSIRVFFMVDGDFEVLTPLRIRHHPGVALTVVQKESTDSMEAVKRLTVTDVHPPNYSNDNTYSPHTAATTTVANTRSRRSMIDTQQAFQAYLAHHNSLAQALTLGQKELASSLITSMDRHYDQLQLEISKNLTLSAQIADSQTQIVQMQHDAARMQQQMQGTLQETLGRLALIQSRIQALLTQTFELHEYPIPRLFIVLPKDRELWDNLNPFTHKFRLYFLCECGEHTRSAGSTIPHHIHLAKHGGYDLERPTEFFRKYGTYILTMMEMVRFGIATAGIVVPVLEQPRLLDGMDDISKSLAVPKEAFGSLVNDAINYVQSHTESEGFVNEEEGEFKMTGREALEGADLRQLASFLGSKDKARTLGNLYRVITKEGHVKWVCLNHYRENYKSSASAQLEELVKVLEGIYDEQQGVVRVSLSSRTVADQFYEAMTTAKGVQELSLKLSWDVTKADLQRLQSEIAKSGIACLEIDGAMFDHPSLDVVNRNSRFDPLVHMVVNAQLQSFSLLNCPRFLDRISDLRKKTGSSLRRLMLSEVFPPKVSTSTRDTLLKLLQCFPQLSDFGFSVEADIERTLALLQYPIQGHERLSTISLYSADKEAEAVFQVLDDTIPGLSSALFPSRIDTVHFNSGYLRCLSITRIISPDHRPILRGILHTSPQLTDISISIYSYDILFEMAFFRQHASRISTSLRVVFTEIESKNTIASVVYSPTSSSSSSLEYDSLPRYTAIPSTGGHKRYLSSQRIAMDVQEWNYEFIIGSIQDDEAAALDRATEQHPNVVHKWSLDVSKLSRRGLQHVVRVLSRSDLSFMTLICQPIVSKDDLQEDIVSFLAEVPWHNIRVIAVIGEAVDKWLTVLYQSWQRHGTHGEKTSDNTSDRQSFGQLQWFEVHCTGTKQEISHTSVLWIQTMLSTFSVRSLRLCNLDLEDQDWNLIMDAVDFTKLQHLSLRKSNFAQLDRLLERVPIKAPLRKLILMFTAWSKAVTGTEREEALKRFREKAPKVQISTGH